MLIGALLLFPLSLFEFSGNDRATALFFSSSATLLCCPVSWLSCFSLLPSLRLATYMLRMTDVLPRRIIYDICSCFLLMNHPMICMTELALSPRRRTR
ncbi:hypothetical protein B0H67DRAFT_334207 [Lasiosphaeris hirsuta]|uniref:Uncharacterized protein n=1 Tax=Lasiosphaeris hirsuta TaxID=260670 RepID=A0AA40DM47_9PEZI|nr:hypothetical protein B0H67DRAFT_334207 [Lasiosphaeris hirsuta]